jgi:hypothetical protein
MPHADFGMKMLFSPLGHNGLFITNIIIIIILFFDRETGGNASPRPAGPLGLLSAALRWEAEGGGDSCATFYVLV